MEKITRREAIASGTCFAGAVATGTMMTGCTDSLRNEKMIYRKLGQTGLEASVIGFGAE